MKRRVVIIGAGAAGLAAAWSATREGHEVTVVSESPGASALGGGAVDDRPWEQVFRAARSLGGEIPPRPVDPRVLELVRDLGLWDVPDDRVPWLATTAGRIRPARGRDRALLDLGAIPSGEVLLPRVERAGWDADTLARGFAHDPFAIARGLRFTAIDLPVIRYDDERRIPDYDLALRHDAPARLEWLATRLREALGRGHPTRAFLLGPFLGAREPRAEELSRRVGVPIGEVLLGAGSPAGLRFEAARDRLLGAIAARVIADRVTAIERDEDGRLALSLTRAKKPLRADGVVLALGGLTGGGLIYQPAEHHPGADLPPGARVPFALSLRAEVTLAAQLAPVPSGALPMRLGPTSSLHGPELDLVAWPVNGHPGALESVGVRCEGVRAAPDLAAAGDVIAGRPRTLLEALASGVRAGREA
jgi:glycerol-3-phosphate dehydrogenase subunit B